MIRINKISLGDRIMVCDREHVVTLGLLSYLKEGEYEISRVKCTSPKMGEREHYIHVMCPDGEIRIPLHLVYSIHGKGDYFQFYEHRDIPVVDCFIPLALDLPKPEPKPLFADAAIGDLVRFSNGQVEEIFKFKGDDFCVKNTIEGTPVFKRNGVAWINNYIDNKCKTIATELIKKGTAEWAWEMMVKGNKVVNPNWKHVGYYYVNSDGYLQASRDGKDTSIPMINNVKWIKDSGFNGWQLYTPEPVKPETICMDCQSTHNKLMQESYDTGFADGKADMQKMYDAYRKEYDPIEISARMRENYENGIEFGKAQAVRVVNASHCDMMFCEKCVSSVDICDNFCHACGEPLCKK